MNTNEQIQYINKHRPKIAVMQEPRVVYKSAAESPTPHVHPVIHVHQLVDSLLSEIQFLQLRLQQLQSRYANLEIALTKSIEISQMILKEKK